MYIEIVIIYFQQDGGFTKVSSQLWVLGILYANLYWAFENLLKTAKSLKRVAL
jgi:hypothetical protein